MVMMVRVLQKVLCGKVVVVAHLLVVQVVFRGVGWTVIATVLLAIAIVVIHLLILIVSCSRVVGRRFVFVWQNVDIHIDV